MHLYESARDFEPDGVAHHPSDKGMALIAKRIINCLDSNGVI
ncbi:MAG: hypothetical protein UHE86_06535 [Acutalibacteraceae bacterium]|nr:hypothetical protein [Acutalibacteraceae bacterium]